MARPASEPSAGAMIEVRGLCKRYGSFDAVREISFEVDRGEVLGFLGPNGAGKSTTMKILTCYMAPTDGTAFVGGADVRDGSIAVREQIGYLPEDTPIYPEMTVLEYLEFVGRIRGLDAKRRRERTGELCRVCGVLDQLAKPVGQLSKGLRQRVGLVQALLHDPPILILDEPTSGLDPNQIAEIRELIREIGREKTVILSTHILSEVQATCDRAIIIHEGKLVADGPLDELAERRGKNEYRLAIDPGDADEQAVRERLSEIDGIAAVRSAAGEEGEIELVVHSDSDSDLRRELFRCACDSGWMLLEMQRARLSLEDVFRELTKG